jgi:hypothetical protein
LSSPAAATPGPSAGRYFLEAEDARVLVASPASFGVIQRKVLPAPWSGAGALEINYSNQATQGQTVFALRWDMEIATDNSVPARGQGYDAFLLVRRDNTAPEVDLEVEAVNSSLGGGAPVVQGRNQVPLFADRFGTPSHPTMVPIGNLAFGDLNVGGPVAVGEVIDLVFTLRAFDPLMQGDGHLLIDGLVLLRR